MSLRYKILAAVIGITVVVLSLALTVILLELVDTKQEFERFDQALRQRIIRNIVLYPDAVWKEDSPFVQHEFIREIIHVRGQEARGRISVTKGERSMDEEAIRAMVRRAILEGRTIIEADAFAKPDKSEKAGLAPGGTWFALDIPNFNPHEPLQRVYLVLLVGLVMIIVVIYVVLSRSVIRPIERLVRAAKRLAQGDYSRPVPLTGRADEIDTLVEAFNRMMLELVSYRENMEVRAEEARCKAQDAEKNLTIAQRLAAMGQLASGIAHEVNNPLAGLMNAARRLRDGALSTEEKKREYGDLILDGLERIQETVKKILQFTPHRVAPQAVQIETVLNRSLSLASHRIEREGMEVVVDLPPGALVFGDPFELQQVLLNLLINSMDAIGVAGRPGEIQIRGHEVEGELRMEFEDNGCGMTEEQVSQAFDLFFSTKEVGEGTGLGLSIAHNVIVNHGGRIEVRSRLGEGATVVVVLPLLSGE